MKKHDRNLEFAKITSDFFFDYEVEAIELACNYSKRLHATKDISASGDQTEIPIREFFRKKLPEKYYISNGHIIDTSLICSPQFDIIIADNFKTPVLYETLNKTEYLAFESVYAIGEIKTSWNKKYLLEFINTIRNTKDKLNRKPVSPNFIDIGGKGAELEMPITKHPYKNPLFNFMFFTFSKDFDIKNIKKVFQETDWKYLPNIICILDIGIIVNINKKDLVNNELKLNLYPEFISQENKDNYEWIFINFPTKSGALGGLYYFIIEHLNSCVLQSPDMLMYMQKLFNIRLTDIDFLSETF